MWCFNHQLDSFWLPRSQWCPKLNFTFSASYGPTQPAIKWRRDVHFFCLFSGEFYLYHSKSPLNHHLGEYVFIFFAKHLHLANVHMKFSNPNPYSPWDAICIPTVHLPSKSSEKKSLAKYTVRQPMDDMDVSENKGTPKSSIFVGFSIINHPFGVPLFLETPICRTVLGI